MRDWWGVRSRGSWAGISRASFLTISIERRSRKWSECFSSRWSRSRSIWYTSWKKIPSSQPIWYSTESSSGKSRKSPKRRFRKVSKVLAHLWGPRMTTILCKWSKMTRTVRISRAISTSRLRTRDSARLTCSTRAVSRPLPAQAIKNRTKWAQSRMKLQTTQIRRRTSWRTGVTRRHPKLVSSRLSPSLSSL